MNRMTGIILMVIGGLTFVAGVFLFSNSSNDNIKQEIDDELDKVVKMAIADGVLTSNERQIIKQLTDDKNLDFNEIITNLENQIAESITDSETEIIDYNKKNGNDFEKFVVRKFDKRFFTIKEWAGDKFVNGQYAKTTLQPNLLLEFRLKQRKRDFSVECKWRKSLYKNGIELANKEQLKRYKDFQTNKNIPVFIAIGIGGKGESPKQFFIIPLNELDDNFIHIDKLEKYEKNLKNNFFFDIDTEELK